LRRRRARRGDRLTIVGLTGGIAMGKSTIAAVFRRAGLPVFDADAAVRRLQAPGGRALPAIEAAFPGTVRAGCLDRAALRATALASPEALRRLEAILHPLVRAEQRRFLARARASRQPVAVLDIPLLAETADPRAFDTIVVVSAPAAVQRARLRARGRMSEAEIAAILARQAPDGRRRRLADAVIRTGLSRGHAVRAAKALIRGWLGDGGAASPGGVKSASG
jgi:dephospho-CoA kinase